MIQSKEVYFIADIGIGHLRTTKDKWVEIASASSLIDTGRLLQFNDAKAADAYVEMLREKGVHVQALQAEDIPWDAPPIDSSAGAIVWPRIKDIIKKALEKAVTSQKNFREHAKAIGVSYEDYLAAAITQLISEEIESQLND